MCFVIGVAVLGAWPPFVAVESGSMEPAIERGDLVVVTAIDRGPWGGIDGSSTPGSESGSGDIIVFSPPGHEGPPILHRVAFAVESGEDWTERGDGDLIDGECETLRYCPAPHDGYITYGDANGEYDQSAGLAPVVHPDWIDARAAVTVPHLGWPRLGFDAAVAHFGTVGVVAVGTFIAFSGGVLGVLLGRVYDRL
ncbi:signal peptidase, endoplasmic reticulum-type [Halorubrum vacuolatum]|uniref:Signal peptidase, endoplasmic reticulum-type n=2 Tax=Halorubrum vacuolatum TaxID=63740 RepID=A0A238UTM9_HALVU|nr:signal peptidase, endoplasmic reticulum-type [Halorubrum vacuolatum]